MTTILLGTRHSQNYQTCRKINLLDRLLKKILFGGLKILHQTAEKAEKWRRRRNYAMFVSFYSKCVHMLEVVDRDATNLFNFLINPDIQLKVASFL